MLKRATLCFFKFRVYFCLMKQEIFTNEEFIKQDYSENGLAGKEYSGCTFFNCNLSGINLSDKEFIDCAFENCNLGNVTLKNTGLKSVNFVNCKLIGIDFSLCKEFLFSVKFHKCQLDYAVFLKMNLKKTSFHECVIREASFIESNLTGASFPDCDLSRTIFEMSNLGGTDFRTAYNYSINPDTNIIKGAKFSYPAVLGLMDKYEIQIS